MTQNDLDEISNQISELQVKRQGIKNTLFHNQSDWFSMLELTFESSSQRTPEYIKFHRLFKRQFGKTLKELGANIVKISGPNHFDASGFFRMKNGKIFYFRLEDLRWSKESLLIRTAKNFEDYTGGINQFVSLQYDFEQFVNELREVIDL